MKRREAPDPMTKSEALQMVHRIQRAQLAMKQGLDLALLVDGETMIQPDVQEFLTGMDAATDAVAARLQRLADKAPGLNAESKAALQSEITKLQAMGKDPEDPFPADAPAD